MNSRSTIRYFTRARTIADTVTAVLAVGTPPSSAVWSIQR